MTDNGTFIINGTERVIVTQLHRSPGRLLHAAGEGPVRGPDHPLPRVLGGVRVRPEEPAVRAHRPQAQVPGHGVPARARPRRPTSEILRNFYKSDRMPRPRGQAALEGLREPAGPEAQQERSTGPRTPRGKREELAARRQAASPPPCSQQMQKPEVEERRGRREADLEGAFTVADIVDPRTGEVLLEANEPLPDACCRRSMDRESQVAPSRSSSPSGTRSAP